MQGKSSNNIGGLIVKTLVFLLVLTVLLTTIFLVAFPKQSSNVMTKLGIDNLASKYSKVAYERSKDFVDLTTTFDKSVLADNYAQVKKYGQILIEDVNFDDYVQFRNAGNPNFDYEKWALGNIASAKVHVDGVMKAVASLELDILTNYFEGHPLTYIINELIENKMKVNESEIKFISDEMEQVFQGQEDREEDCLPIIVDAYVFSKNFCESDMVAKWQQRYENLS